MNEIRLYRKNQLGIGTWRIWHGVIGSMNAELFYAHAVVEGGSEVLHMDTVGLNKSGRNIMEQVDLEMRSRINRQLDKGYKATREEALLGSTNQLGLLNPMLAVSLNKIPVPRFDEAHVQPKLDGHRCLITNQGGAIFAYTRKGKTIDTIPHILNDFKWLPDGLTVDGELYIHGQKLQKISSLIKRMQPGSADLRYHWYDYINPNPFNYRFRRMQIAGDRFDMPSVSLVETPLVKDMDRVMELFQHFRSEGYEGVMLRLSTNGYQDNVRASQLIKVKERDDCEVTVLGAETSKDGWAVLRVRMDNGIEFDTSAPGTVPEKTEVLNNIESYIGRRLTIEYAMLTEDGVPFHAVATRWRDEE